MSEWKQKRFWTRAEAGQTDGGFDVRLDGRSVKTPAKAPLIVPTQAMADAIAAEWDAQDGTVDPLSMPVTRSANAAIDKVAPQFDEVCELLAAYGDSDLLCYRADSPQELVDRQAARWDPALDWAADTLGARLQPRVGVMHAPQTDEALSCLANALRAHSPFQMAALHDLISLSGSLVLGLAAAQGWQTAEDIWALSRLDEDWQEEQWGPDEEAAEVAAIKRTAFLHARWFFDLASLPA